METIGVLFVSYNNSFNRKGPPMSGKSFWFLVITGFGLLFFPRTCRAEDGIEMFLTAVDTHQPSAVLSVRGFYNLVVTPGEKSEEGNPQSDGEPSASQKRISGAFQFGRSDEGEEYTKRELVFEDDRSPTICIQKRAASPGAKQSDTAFFESAASMVIVSDTAFATPDFRRFGRVQGPIFQLISSVIDLQGLSAAKDMLISQAKALQENKIDAAVLEIKETKPFEDGSESYVIESRLNGKTTQRYTIVPALGYICPSEQLYDPGTGNLTNEYIASNYVLNESSGLYYPTTYIESEHNPATGNLIEKKEYTLDRESLSLNDPILPESFVLDVPEGLQVLDARNGKQDHYVADSAGSLSLAPGGLDLKKLPWLSKADRNPSKDAASAGNKGIYARIMFIVIGIFLVLSGIFMAVHKRKG